MDDKDTLELLVIALCLAGSMFFSGSETAVTSFGERRARRIKEEGGRDARTVSDWVDRPVFVLSTILLGNNVTNTLMGAMATAFAIRHLGGDGMAVPIAVVLTTGLLLVFGEIVPKALGRAYSPKVALPALAVLRPMGRLFYPIVWLLHRMTQAVLYKVTSGEVRQLANRVTVGELGYLVKLGEREGSIPAEQAALLQGVFRFEEKIVRDIMVPVDRVSAVDLAWDFEKIRRVAQSTGHSRLPVYVNDIDNVQGILHIKQLVGMDTGIQGADDLRRILRPPFFVSESLLIQDLLRRFKEQRVHLAVVVDDAGDTVGVVTLEDVLEQIVGQIFDETDRAPRVAPVDNAGMAYFDGQDSLSRVEEHFDVELDEIDGVDSVGDLLARLAGQMPIAGSVFVWENLRFKVLAADAKRIIRIRVEKIELEDDETE